MGTQKSRNGLQQAGKSLVIPYVRHTCPVLSITAHTHEPFPRALDRTGLLGASRAAVPTRDTCRARRAKAPASAATPVEGEAFSGKRYNAPRGTSPLFTQPTFMRVMPHGTSLRSIGIIPQVLGGVPVTVYSITITSHKNPGKNILRLRSPWKRRRSGIGYTAPANSARGTTVTLSARGYRFSPG